MTRHIFTMITVKILIFYLFLAFCTGARMFKYPEMCNLNKEINDCSYQFSHTNTCYVYSRRACESFDFSPWNLKPLYRSVSELDSEFSVSILPYAAYIHKVQIGGTPYSAINLMLTSFNKDITGFSFEIMKNNWRDYTCGIFDFRKSADNISIPFTFYYDCLHLLVEKEWKNVSMVFRAYPLNIELSYLVYIPPVPKENFNSVCDWKPLVMVFNGSLPEYDVYIKFSNAPENLKIDFFNVTLVDSFGTADHNIIPATNSSEMITSTFRVSFDGNYIAFVGIISSKESCIVSGTDYFYVGKEIKDYSLMLFIILLMIMIICASLLLYFSCQWYIKNAPPTSKPTLLFVYSYKRLHHEFLLMYSRYLSNHYGLKVNMIYEKSGNPKKWLEEKYSQSDVVVFVISPSLKTLDQGSCREEEHHWVNQLAEAKALIDDSYIGRKKVCKICFSYSKKDDMPKCLERQGPFFMLPKDLDKFLCYIFGCPHKLYLLSKLFCQNHHRVLKPDIKQDNDEEIKEKLEVIMKTTKRVSPISNVENINESSVKQKIKKYESSMLEGKKNLPSSINYMQKSEDSNSELLLVEKSLSEPENDDFMLYCVRTILYSREKPGKELNV